MSRDPKSLRARVSKLGVITIFGAAIGTAVGAVLGNVSLGVGVGAALGLVTGIGYEYYAGRKRAP